jgi:hypothetical protein
MMMFSHLWECREWAFPYHQTQQGNGARPRLQSSPVTTLSLDAVEAIRANIARAHTRTATRFREAFAEQALGPGAYRELFAEAMLECVEGVQFDGDINDIRYPDFTIERTPEAVFTYWLVVSEMIATATWAMTKVLATREEYDDALRKMQSPQIVRALIVDFLPRVEWRDDGTALLEAVVYTRAVEERVERRSLILDTTNELHYHGRELLAEGRGGIDPR